MREQLQKVNDYVVAHQAEVDQAYRLSYHTMPPIGWINDPNGFIYYGGAYHLFCQYYPYDSVWGPMHWGHWRSTDLIHWTWLSVIMAPDSPFDDTGCFSGHAIEKDGKLYLLYTGVQANPGGEAYQHQCLAVSEDGLTFAKYEGNPVIGIDALPDGASPHDFRDPKVFPVAGGYRAIMAARGKDGGQQLSFFSKDLLTWRCDGPFLSGVGDMLECPDYFTLDGKKVLISCVMNMPPDGLKYPNTQPVVYFTGSATENDAHFAYEQMASVDYGLDFYAPQTALAPDGRRILIGWMQCWGHIWPTHTRGHGWSGAMTLPREISLQDGKLLQRPIQELEACRSDAVHFDKGPALQGTLAPAAEVSVSFLPGSATHLAMRVMSQDAEHFLIAYDVRAQTLTVDRSHCGYPMTEDGSAEKEPRVSAHVPLWDGRLSLRVFLDTCSVEVFANEGAVAMTSLAFPKSHGTGFSMEADAQDAMLEVTAWRLDV